MMVLLQFLPSSVPCEHSQGQAHMKKVEKKISLIVLALANRGPKPLGLNFSKMKYRSDLSKEKPELCISGGTHLAYHNACHTVPGHGIT